MTSLPVRYERLGVLGDGGFGQVLLGRGHGEAGFSKLVALKVLHPRFASDELVLKQLRDEARILGLVRHRAIVGVDALLKLDGQWTIVLEYVAGSDCAELLAQHGPLAPPVAMAIVAEVADALWAAWQAEGEDGPLHLEHRDIKPANIRVTPDGDVKLLDFGIATARFGGREAATRRVMGSPPFMSPERYQGQAGPPADVYALGSTVLALLTGLPMGPARKPEQHDARLARAATALESGPVRDLVLGMLAWHPAVRPGVQQLRDRAERLAGGLRPWARRNLAVGTGAAHTMDLGVTMDVVQASTPAASSQVPAPPPKAPPALPAERDAFVGREQELDALEQALAQGRLVSVLGIGGSGKTRLVTRFAWQHLDDWPGGVWFCDLSEARSLDDVYGAVARALDLPLGGQDPSALLGQVLCNRGRCLVVLDNFEQVARHGAALLEPWLQQAPQAHFLLTTRELLGLRGERRVLVPPLRADEALVLFKRRAAVAKPGFRPSADDVDAMVSLVDLLDRLPLALELAAARVRVLSPRKLLARMDQRFRLLAASGGRGDRHATLRATLDWSWELLSAEEQSGLAQLSVFEGGFSLEAAEEILELEEAWPMDTIQALVDKSLVRQVDDADRFDLLVSVQAYAQERLVEAAGVARAEARHAAWFAALGQDGGNRHAHAELDNLVAACRRAALAGDGRTAVDALEGAWGALELRGPFDKGLELADQVAAIEGLELHQRVRVDRIAATALLGMGRLQSSEARLLAALALLEGQDGGVLRARLLGGLGWARLRLGRLQDAQASLEEGLEIARQLGDRQMEGWLGGNLGSVLLGRGQPRAARLRFEEALALLQETGDRHFQGKVLANLGIASTDLGHSDEAMQYFEAAIDLHRELGDRHSEAGALASLAIQHAVEGRLGTARPLLESALGLFRDLGDRRAEGWVLGNLAELNGLDGRVVEAQAGFERALAIHRQVANRRDEGVTLGNLGSLHVGAGRLDQARARFSAGEACLREVADHIELAKLLLQRVHLELADGQADTARQVFAEADGLVTQLGVGEGSELGQGRERARAALTQSVPGTSN